MCAVVGHVAKGALYVIQSHIIVRKAELGRWQRDLYAPGFALLVPPVSVNVSILAALPAAVPVTAVPPPLLLVAAAPLALPATVAPSGLLTAAWNLILCLVCAFSRPAC